MKATRLGLALGIALLAAPALAHTGAGPAHGLAAGLVHPLLGLDHLLAMVAVGLWAGLAGGRAIWAWPAAFVTVMLLGATLGLRGIGLPGAEAGIALSVLLLGVAVAGKLRAPAAFGAILCGTFAVFHGHAHGAELPADTAAASYIIGFSAATAFLHAVGIAMAVALARTSVAWLPRLAGGAVAATGLVLLLG
jgi:urease accessory protein